MVTTFCVELGDRDFTLGQAELQWATVTLIQTKVFTKFSKMEGETIPGP